MLLHLIQNGLPFLPGGQRFPQMAVWASAGRSREASRIVPQQAHQRLILLSCVHAEHVGLKGRIRRPAYHRPTSGQRCVGSCKGACQLRVGKAVASKGIRSKPAKTTPSANTREPKHGAASPPNHTGQNTTLAVRRRRAEAEELPAGTLAHVSDCHTESTQLSALASRARKTRCGGPPTPGQRPTVSRHSMRTANSSGARELSSKQQQIFTCNADNTETKTKKRIPQKKRSAKVHRG